jgi:hypothetical protein
MEMINKNFGIKGGINCVHARCFANEDDLRNETNCLSGKICHPNFMKDDQFLLIDHPVETYLNEGYGETCSIKLIMNPRDFNKKFEKMCIAIFKGESTIF